MLFNRLPWERLRRCSGKAGQARSARFALKRFGVDAFPYGIAAGYVNCRILGPIRAARLHPYLWSHPDGWNFPPAGTSPLNPRWATAPPRLDRGYERSMACV